MNRIKIHVKKGDNVEVISGNFRGSSGKVLEVIARKQRVLIEGVRLIKRLALVAEKGRIVKVFYPVFPPDRNAETVLAWLRRFPPGTAAVIVRARDQTGELDPARNAEIVKIASDGDDPQDDMRLVAYRLVVIVFGFVVKGDVDGHG